MYASRVLLCTEICSIGMTTTFPTDDLRMREPCGGTSLDRHCPVSESHWTRSPFPPRLCTGMLSRGQLAEASLVTVRR